jgi:Skp family chaperone for outer membrane proteins
MAEMNPNVAAWVASYKELAEEVINRHVAALQQEFPDERFPVRPPYRRSVYHHLLQIVDDLQHKMQELLEESPDETDAELQDTLSALQEQYERDFAIRTRKERDKNHPED